MRALFANPELVRILRTKLRPRQMLLFGGGTALVLGLMLAGMYWAQQATLSFSLTKMLSTFYFTVAWLQMAVLLLYGLIQSAQAISHERERWTFDFQRLVAMGPRKLVLGKLLGAPSDAFFIVAVGLLFQLVPVFKNIVPPMVFVRTLVLLLMAGLSASAIGLFLSSIVQKTQRATGLATAIPIFLFFTHVAHSVASPGSSTVWHALSPFTLLTFMSEEVINQGANPGFMFYGFQIPLIYGYVAWHAAIALFFYLMTVRRMEDEEFSFVAPRHALAAFVFLQAVLLGSYLNPPPPPPPGPPVGVPVATAPPLPAKGLTPAQKRALKNGMTPVQPPPAKTDPAEEKSGAAAEAKTDSDPAQQPDPADAGTTISLNPSGVTVTTVTPVAPSAVPSSGAPVPSSKQPELFHFMNFFALLTLAFALTPSAELLRGRLHRANRDEHWRVLFERPNRLQDSTAIWPMLVSAGIYAAASVFLSSQAGVLNTRAAAVTLMVGTMGVAVAGMLLYIQAYLERSGLKGGVALVAIFLIVPSTAIGMLTAKWDMTVYVSPLSYLGMLNGTEFDTSDLLNTQGLGATWTLPLIALSTAILLPALAAMRMRFLLDLYHAELERERTLAEKTAKEQGQPRTPAVATKALDKLAARWEPVAPHVPKADEPPPLVQEPPPIKKAPEPYVVPPLVPEIKLNAQPAPAAADTPASDGRTTSAT
ncbi:MAG: ABC transporter permease [Planctomycetes bacterium]|nr:ABC transporter permease [Planctomycetota bacterium]